MAQQQKRRRKRYRVTLTASNRTQPLTCEVESLSTVSAVYDAGFGKSVHLPMPPDTAVIGEVTKATYQASIEVICLGLVLRRKSSPAERAAKLAALQTRKEAKEAEEKQREEERNRRILAARERIINQIELAFEKKMKDAMHYVTCDGCSKKATRLVVQRLPEGSVVPFKNIVGALCDGDYHPHWDKRPTVACAAMEFFYDGMSQLHLNKGVKAA